MNDVFEDLLDELKEEQLIEEKVNTAPEKIPAEKILNDDLLDLPEFENKETIDSALSALADISATEVPIFGEESMQSSSLLKELESLEADTEGEFDDVPEIDLDEDVLDLGSSTVIELDSINPAPSEKRETPKKKVKKKLTPFEIFTKRSVQEVASLQMVDHIFCSVEREQMKISSLPFNDLPAKQVLHSFLKMPADTGPEEQAQAALDLRKETEPWYAALSERDQNITVENLRYCCENSRPPLSPPALLGLARFYRNEEFSEARRNKFDLLITRLFSSDLEEKKRDLVFSKSELEEHLSELYTEWQSEICYPEDKSDETVNFAVSEMEKLISEANRANSLDELIESQFFTRVRALKRDTAQAFFSPTVAATSIICNVVTGNRYSELLRMGLERSFAETIDDKYSFLFDQSVAAATSKSMELVEILNQHRVIPSPFDLNEISRKGRTNSRGQNRASQYFENPILQAIFGFEWLFRANKWVLGLTVLSILLSVALVLWVEVFDTPLKTSPKVQAINLEKTEFKRFVESARMSNETLFVVATAEFKDLKTEKKEELLTRLLENGAEKGYRKVHLFDQDNITIGSATADNIELK